MKTDTDRWDHRYRDELRRQNRDRETHRQAEKQKTDRWRQKRALKGDIEKTINTEICKPISQLQFQLREENEDSSY